MVISFFVRYLDSDVIRIFLVVYFVVRQFLWYSGDQTKGCQNEVRVFVSLVKAVLSC